MPNSTTLDVSRLLDRVTDERLVLARLIRDLAWSLEAPEDSDAEDALTQIADAADRLADLIEGDSK